MPVLEPPIETSLRVLTPDQKAQFERDGYFTAHGLFSPDEVAEIRAAFMAQAERGRVPGMFEQKSGETAETTDPLARYPRMMNPHEFDDQPVGAVSKKYLLDARYHDILHDLYGEEPIAMQSMFYFKPAGARGQALHQDNFYLRVAPGTCMAAWLSVDDADEENGTLMVVPGSHKGEVVCPQQADPSVSFTTEFVQVPSGMEEIPVILKAGDVLFFNGSLIHGSYPNLSEDRFRRAFICHYAQESCKEISNFYCPVDFAGVRAERETATGGGPCGTERVSGSIH